jgi:hypothetical protein
MRPDDARFGLAAAVTPLVPAFYGACFFAQPWALAVLLPYGYAAELLIGLPLALWFRRNYWRRPTTFGAAGLISTIPLLTGYAWLGSPPHFAPFDLTAALTLCCGGFLSGLVFWLLGISGNAPLRWRDLIDPMP